MGEHDTWYTLLPFWKDLEHSFEAGLRRDWEWLMFTETSFTLVHVGGAVIAMILIIIAASLYRSSLSDETNGIVPPKRWGLAAMIDGIVRATFNMSKDVMGEKDAAKFLPLTGTLALFIFCCNIQALVPGFLPPTDTLKTNAILAFMVFIIYHFVGFRRNGLHYLAHFAGPKWWLAPLLFPIEIISHFVRPVSLMLRLMGNILADHKVVLAIAGLLPLVAPIPFLLLGVMVCIVQTLVFTLLTIIYIAMAAEHAEEH